MSRLKTPCLLDKRGKQIENGKKNKTGIFVLEQAAGYRNDVSEGIWQFSL